MNAIITLLNVVAVSLKLGGVAWAGVVIIPHFMAIMNKNVQKVEEGKDAVIRTLAAVAGMYLSAEIIQWVLSNVGG